MKKARRIFLLLFVLCLFLTGVSCTGPTAPSEGGEGHAATEEGLPFYDGSAYVSVSDGKPRFFAEECASAVAFETYAPQDALGRCGAAFACIGQELMPTEERGSIGQVKPSGWHTVKYDFVDGKYLYNRCHLIGFQLTGENANEENLITGTRYMNVEGMLPFENMVADFIRETGFHVLYRVTPHFVGRELVARGVWIEAYSVEDAGEGIEFFVYCYNVQPGVEIDYATGESRLAESAEEKETGEARQFVLNTNSKKFHLPSCPSADTIAPHNRETRTAAREDLIKEGYSPCGACRP